MATSLTITFVDAQQLSKFVQVVSDYAADDRVNGGFVKQALKGELAVLPDDQRQCSLFVSGQKLIDGTLKDLNKRFEQEIASHSASVEIREMLGGEWRKLRTRRNPVSA